MPRSSMTALIGKVRVLIGDQAAPQDFTDDEIEDALDRSKRIAVDLPLTPIGAFPWTRYVTSWGAWEANAILRSGDTTVTPDSSDLETGEWTFTTPRQDNLTLTGSTYDLYAAAADLLESYAAKTKAEFDFSTESSTYTRSGKSKRAMELAALYRKRIRFGSAPQVRSDEAQVSVSAPRRHRLGRV